MLIKFMDLESIYNNYQYYINILLLIMFCNSRLFITFNEFTNVLKNTISPPVFKTKNLKHVKFKECEEQINYENNIVDLRLLVNNSKFNYYYLQFKLFY